LSPCFTHFAVKSLTEKFLNNVTYIYLLTLKKKIHEYNIHIIIILCILHYKTNKLYNIFIVGYTTVKTVYIYNNNMYYILIINYIKL
jgi:hypothetical protein